MRATPSSTSSARPRPISGAVFAQAPGEDRLQVEVHGHLVRCAHSGWQRLGHEAVRADERPQVKRMWADGLAIDDVLLDRRRLRLAPTLRAPDVGAKRRVGDAHERRRNDAEQDPADPPAHLDDLEQPAADDRRDQRRRDADRTGPRLAPCATR